MPTFMYLLYNLFSTAFQNINRFSISKGMLQAHSQLLNILRQRQDGRRLANDIQMHFLKWKDMNFD